MGMLFGKVWEMSSSTKPKILSLLGLNAAGKTTILYRLINQISRLQRWKTGDLVDTEPTMGFNVETIVYRQIKLNSNLHSGTLGGPVRSFLQLAGWLCISHVDAALVAEWNGGSRVQGGLVIFVNLLGDRIKMNHLVMQTMEFLNLLLKPLAWRFLCLFWIAACDMDPGHLQGGCLFFWKVFAVDFHGFVLKFASSLAV